MMSVDKPPRAQQPWWSYIIYYNAHDMVAVGNGSGERRGWHRMGQNLPATGPNQSGAILGDLLR